MKTMVMWAGFRVVVRHPIPRQPKWYDFPRRLGWRPLKFDYMIEKGQTYLDSNNHIMYVRADDMPALMKAMEGDTPVGLIQDPVA